MADKIDNLFLDANIERLRISQQYIEAENDEERNNVNAGSSLRWRAAEGRAIGFYKNNYRTNAINYKKELLNRVPGHRNERLDSIYVTPRLVNDLQDIANDLRIQCGGLGVKSESGFGEDRAVFKLNKLAEEGFRHVQKCQADLFSNWIGRVSALVHTESKENEVVLGWDSSIPPFDRTPDRICLYAGGMLKKLENAIQRIIEQQR